MSSLFHASRLSIDERELNLYNESVHQAPERSDRPLFVPCESGGTGRRAGLRIQWDIPWGFESPLSHHPLIMMDEKEICSSSNH